VYRRSFIVSMFTLCTTVLTTTRRACAWDFITNEELEREKSASAAQSKEAPASAAPPQLGAPTIDVEQPDATKPITSPVTIRIRFKPQSGATIDPSSFRAKYGWLGIDITSRIIANAKVDASGVVAENANIPAGQYQVTLQIADNLHRVGTRVLSFAVT
jgi:hypothetical protein